MSNKTESKKNSGKSGTFYAIDLVDLMVVRHKFNAIELAQFRFFVFICCIPLLKKYEPIFFIADTSFFFRLRDILLKVLRIEREGEKDHVMA